MNKRHIPSLSIRNYRCLGNLDIDPLAHVNLIVGPNNIGKSSLLEAILLWGTEQHSLTIRDILLYREGCNVESPDRFRMQPFLGLHNLFSGFPVLSPGTSPISVGTADKKQTTKLRIYPADSPRNFMMSSGPPIAFGSPTDSNNTPGVTLLGEELKYPPDEERRLWHYLDNKCLYLSPNMNGAARIPTSKLWEQVEIASRETAVIDALRLIESGIEKVFFIGSNPRMPVCRIKGLQHPVSLHGMGDGVVRLFELILGIVNVADGICLIDEFENGLHWSVQEQVWDVVFQTAKKLDVQIFATTHSYDTVKAFQTVALRQENGNFGEIIQMRKRGGVTIANPIVGDEIRKILQYEVEVR